MRPDPSASCKEVEFLRRRGLARVDADGAEDHASEEADVPEEAESPEGVVAGGALGEVCEVGVHGGEEGLAETGALCEGDAGRKRRRDDPTGDGEEENGEVELEVDALGDLKFHPRAGGGRS